MFKHFFLQLFNLRECQYLPLIFAKKYFKFNESTFLKNRSHYEICGKI